MGATGREPPAGTVRWEPAVAVAGRDGRAGRLVSPCFFTGFALPTTSHTNGRRMSTSTSTMPTPSRWVTSVAISRPTTIGLTTQPPAHDDVDDGVAPAAEEQLGRDGPRAGQDDRAGGDEGSR